MSDVKPSSDPVAAPRRSGNALPPAEEHDLPSTAVAAVLYFGLSLLYFLPAFLPGRNIFGTDYLAGTYFFLEWVSQQSAAGHLPSWNPHLYGGLPVFANPGSTFYPVRWIADLLLPTHMFFPLLFWFQFGIAGLGMYLLARELGCRRWVAFVAGLMFQWTGITMSWVYAGHDGRIIVATFTPLLFYFLHHAIRTGRLAGFVGTAATIGFSLLSFQIQNNWYLLLAAGVWSLFLLLERRRELHTADVVRRVTLGLLAVAFGFAIASVNFLPFLDYVDASPRGMTGGRGYEYSTSFSMPVRAVIGMAVPEQVGASIQDVETGEYLFPVYRGENAFRLHTEYVGALALVLLALGAYYTRRDRRWWFFLSLGFFALTLSLGGNTPLYHLYYAVLPGLKRFRAPDLAYFILAFSVVSMATLTLERLAGLHASVVTSRSPRAGSGSAGSGHAGRVGAIGGTVTAVAVLGMLVFGVPAASMTQGTAALSPAAGWMRFALFAGIATAVLWRWMGGRMTSRVALVALSVLTITDLWVIGRKFFQTVPSPLVTFAQDDVAAFLATQPERSRLWVLPMENAWPPAHNYPMLFGIDMAGGEHGNQLQRWNEYVGAGTQTYVDWHNFLNDPRFLAAANVRWIVAPPGIEAPWLREAYRGLQAVVYENTLALPRAYLVPEARAVPDASRTLSALQDPSWDPRRTAVVETTRPASLPGSPLQGTAEVTRYEADQVHVRTRANRPAMLVLADNMYDGWVATVNGDEVPIVRTNHTFRGVLVPAGEHTVEFVFRPRSLYTGLLVSLGCLSLVVAFAVWLLAAGRRRPDVTGQAPAA